MGKKEKSCVATDEVSCCCTRNKATIAAPGSRRWQIGTLSTRRGEVPQVGTRLTIQERLNNWRVLWGFGRMNYAIPPGLYGVGQPDGRAPVFVTANFKMSFDRLRQELAGLAAWILVLDTKGINVWCAAGKGTFASDELVRRIRTVQLDQVIEHRQLIVPQLGAVGVAAYQVTRKTGFKVLFGPIRANDLPLFLHNNRTATPAMRKVRFSLRDRLTLVPIELIQTWKIVLPILGLLAIRQLVFYHRLTPQLFSDFVPFLAAILTGAFAVPALLPWIPGPAFAWKGWFLGFICTLGFCIISPISIPGKMAYLFILPPISSFLSLNFTGSSTFTSMSGVQKEVLFSVPLMIMSCILGLLILLLKLLGVFG